MLLSFVGGLTDGLSTAYIDSLHSTLKVVTRSLDTKHRKAALKGKKLAPVKYFLSTSL